MDNELIIEKPLLSKVVDTLKTKYRFVVLSLLILTFLTDQTSSQGLALAMIGGMTKKDCTDPTDKGEFCWSESTKAVLLGCYFYGYCLQVIPTTIAKKLGINWAFRIIAVVSGIIQLTFATTVQYSVTLAIIMQTVRGFGASIFMSGLMEFATIWCIGNESKTFISFVGITIQIGQPIGQAIAGLLSSRAGWRAYFYLNGCTFFIMAGLLTVFVPKNPLDSWAMHNDERELYVEKIKAQQLLNTGKQNKITLSTLKNIAPRLYVWAFCIFAFFDVFQLFVLLTATPFYLKEILGASATEVSYIQLGGGLGCSITTVVFMFLLPLVDRNVTWLKRSIAFLILPQLVRIVGYFLLPYVPNLPGAIAVIFITWATWGTAFSGSIVTINYEIDPANSSVILGLFNGIGTLGGFLCPLVRVWMTSVYQYQQDGWNTFFYMNGGLSIIIIAVIFLAVALRRNEWIKDPTIATEQDSKKEKRLELDIIENKDPDLPM